MLSSLITKFQTTIFKQKAIDTSAWVTDLEHMDNLEALKVVTEKISTAPIETSHQAMQQLDELLMIDQAAHERVNIITARYMLVSRENKELEANIVAVTYTYHRRIYLAYIALVDYIVNQKLEITNERILLLLAHTVNASFTMTKWRYFQDQVAPVGAWTHLHTLVKIGEKLSLLHRDTFLYENDAKEITLAALFVRGYMLNTLTKGSFSRQQIELTAKVLDAWIINPKIQREYIASEHAFLVNLKSDKGTDRARGFSMTPDCRYWTTNSLVGNIQTYLCDAETNKPLQRFNLNSLSTATVLVELFKKLLNEWMSHGYKRQRRSENRKPVNKMFNVYNGFDGICQKLAPNTSSAIRTKAITSNTTPFELRVAMHAPIKATSVNFPKHLDTEAWLIVDESENGLGASLGVDLEEWVEPGKLIGFSSPNNSQQFMVAEIRSVKKQPNGRSRVGIEVLSTHSAIAQMSQVGQIAANEVEDGYFVDFSEMEDSQQSQFSGLYLPANIGGTQSPMVIIPKSEYKPSTQYVLNTDGAELRVLTEHAISNKDGWVRAKVTVIS